jgi:hypothetical protein
LRYYAFSLESLGGEFEDARGTDDEAFKVACDMTTALAWLADAEAKAKKPSKKK